MNEPERGAALRGRLVEGVRMIFIALLATGGYRIAAFQLNVTTGRVLLFIFLGAGIGYVLGGIIGRLTLRAVSGIERELRRTPAPQLAGGVVGLARAQQQPSNVILAARNMLVEHVA